MDGVTPIGLGADEAGEAVRHAQAELERAVREGNLAKDPMRLPLGALAVTLGAQHQLHVAHVHQSRATVESIVEAIREARMPIDSVVVDRIEAAAAVGASDRAGQLARMHIWRSGVIAGAVLMGVGVLSAMSGYLAGRSSAVATVSAVQAAAVRDGADAASMWATLMTSNDGTLVARACEKTSARSDGGRRACVVGLWTEPPVNPGPRTVPAGK